MHSTWISMKQVLSLTGWTARTVFRKQRSGELKSRLAKQTSRNGKAVLEYDSSSLPQEAQFKLMAQRVASSDVVPVQQTLSISAVATLPTPKSEATVAALESLDEESRAIAEQRLKILAPMIDFVNRMDGHKPLFRAASGEQFATLSEIVQHLSSTAGVSQSSIWEWWKRFKKDGPGALSDRTRSDAGKSRFFDLHVDAAAFCRNKYLTERLSISLIHRALLREWPRLRAHNDAQAPDYKTLRVYLNSISPLISMLARDGDKVYKEQAAPYIIRDISKIRVNQVWISDHMIHDVWVRNDGVFPELGKDEAFRPWLTCIVDMRSRRVVAPTWCATPSSRSIGSALLLGMRLFGRPEVFYIDNGKDYNRLSDDQTGVLMRLGIKSQHCLPKHPQSKQIESFFRTVHQQFDVLWKPFYAGTSPATRPDDCDVALRKHKIALKTGTLSPLPTASEFIRSCAIYLDEFNESAHSGQGMRGKSPNDIYDAELPPSQRRPVNPVDVAQLFWERDTRKICEGGCIRLENQRYEPADGNSCAALMLRINEEIIVARDPRNLSEAIALTNEREPKYLGHLRSQEMAVHGETSRDMIRLRMRKEGAVRTAVKQYLAAQARQREIAGDITEIEALKRRASERSVIPNIHTLAIPKTVNAAMPQRMHIDEIVDSFLGEE